ncbi:hydrogenase nickel incorporation protein HypB [Marinobacterium weihaiense]|uniref:Hydrogenase maturation factor HypB n=1 Tax=Marinobacterium weihaiense TaxID=2851016 RepID=A0ABS6M6J1_9GAMM|nr:hydrogenase nickel incorporation protein HypB [Marinobacterium weihaiense]MBV0931895.1 hydrogenase nickel incorporation protein HypB [Marinobacterium weihaiense]
MCGICGCNQTDHDGDAQRHGPAHARRLQVELDLFSLNDRHAQANRERFASQQVLVLNLMSSPGSGKTALLSETLPAQQAKWPVAVIEGDQQTQNDAERIRATGVRAVQINTGKLCHLDAHLVGHAVDELEDFERGVLYIENVGNLVCPAGFDLGEAARVVILSVTEGDDKPLKYPDIFHSAQLMVINKIDLAPYVDFDQAQCIANARRINPDIEVIALSARTGEGLQDWQAWVEQRYRERISRQCACASDQQAPC